MPLILPNRQIQQPGGVPRIDWGNPLTAGLVVAYLPTSNVNLVTSKTTVVTGTKQQVSPKGPVKGFGSTLGAGTTDAVDTGFAKGPSAPRSIFAQIRANGSGGGALGRVWQKGSGTGSEYCAVGSGGLSYNCNANSGANLYQSNIPTPATGTNYSLLVAMDGVSSAGAVAYVDGVAIAPGGYGGASVGAANDTDDYIIGNRPDGARNWDGTIGLFLIFDRKLTASEAKLLSDNPWQIFKAPVRDMWINTGAGGSTYSLPATTGTFVETPVAANLKVGKVISNTSASYSVSSTATGLQKNDDLVASTAAYSLSPTSTALKATRNSSAITSAFAVNGIATNLKFGRDIGCNPASYNTTPTAATLERGYKTSPAVATYTLTATAPNLVKGWNLSATTNSYVLSTNTEQNSLTRRVAASTASYVATSVSVVLTKTTARTVSATTASIVFSSQAATLRSDKIFSVATSTYTEAANNASFEIGKRVVTASSTFSVSPTATTLTKVGTAKVLSAATQAVSVSGNNGNLFVGRGIVSAAASSTLASNDVAMRVSRRAQAIVANISVLQNTTTLSRGRTLQLSTATFLIAANNASFGSGKSLAITPAHTVVSSNLVDLRYVHYVNTTRTSTVAGEMRILGVVNEDHTVLVHRENRTALAA